MSSYQCLDRRIQQWIFKQGWSDLRPIQQDAIDPILSKNTDVLISASTASGKTEAFFFGVFQRFKAHLKRTARSFYRFHTKPPFKVLFYHNAQGLLARCGE